MVEENIRHRFPDFQAKSDLEALLLATSTDDISPSQVQAWMDKALQNLCGELAAEEARASLLMDRPAEVTGVRTHTPLPLTVIAHAC